MWGKRGPRKMVDIRGYTVIQREKLRLIYSIDIYCTPNTCPRVLGAGDLELELRYKQRPTQACGKQGWLALCKWMSNGKHSLTQPAG